MFSLIISIIAIALVVALAGASLYYGGASFTESSSKANAAQYMNEASQIAGSISVYKNDEGGVLPSGFALNDLTPSYLVEIPSGEWAVNGSNIVRTGVSGLECFNVNQTATNIEYGSGDTDVTEVDPGKYVPNCDKADLPTEVICCFTP